MGELTSFEQKESIKRKPMLRRASRNGMKFCNVGGYTHCYCSITWAFKSFSPQGSSNDSLLAKVGQAMSGIGHMYGGRPSDKLAFLESFHGAASLGAVKRMHLLEWWRSCDVVAAEWRGGIRRTFQFWSELSCEHRLLILDSSPSFINQSLIFCILLQRQESWPYSFGIFLKAFTPEESWYKNRRKPRLSDWTFKATDGSFWLNSGTLVLHTFPRAFNPFIVIHIIILSYTASSTTVSSCICTASQDPATIRTMKITVPAFIALMPLIANGYVISVCGSTKSFNLGDNHCHDWTDNTFTYQSNAKCTMIMYSGPGCSGTVYSTTQQNTCHTIPFHPQHMNCAKTWARKWDR